MMARANLGALLGNVDDSTPPPSATPTSVPTALKPERVTEVPVLVPEQASSPRPREAKPRQVAHRPLNVESDYLRFVRKEARLREDQQNQLTLHARRLNRRKASTGARITDNTLIRIAIDLLLDRIDRASGDDEASLLESLKP